METTNLTTTQKLWKPISQLQAESEQLGMALRAAALVGDIEAAKQAARRMEEIQREMAQAGQTVREHARQKALAASKAAPDRSNYPALGQMLMHAWEWGIKNGIIRPGVSAETESSDGTQA